MMKTEKIYENFPIWIVLLSNFVSLAIYILGFLIVLRLGVIFAVLYIAFIFTLEYRLLKNHCTNCHYWGKTCGFGRGRLSAAFFKKGDISKFCAMEMTWKNMIPDLLVSLVPFITGIILLILKFDVILLSEVVMLTVFSSYGNSFVRGTLTCRYCQQRESGCPAYLLFNEKK